MRRGPSSESSGLGRPSKEWPRFWLISVLLILAILSVVFLYWKRPGDREEFAGLPAAVDRSLDPTPQRHGPFRAPAQNQILQQAQTPGGSTESTPPEPQEVSTTPKPERFWELSPKARSAYLAEADQEKLSRALASVSNEDKDNVLKALSEMAGDSNDSARQPALQTLLTWPKLDEGTLAEIFGATFGDSDPTLGAFAAGVLTSRNDATASEVLAKAFAAGDANVRLTIIQFIDLENAAAALLHRAASDPDEHVRAFATRALAPTPEPLQGVQ